MTRVRSLRSLTRSFIGLGTLLGTLSACGSNGRPASLVSAGGQSSTAGDSVRGGGVGDAGQPSDVSGSGGEPDDGAAGDVGMVAGPYAVFPEGFQVDVGCGQTPSAVTLVLRNVGARPLTISSLSADSNYVVGVDLPLTIAPNASGNVLVTAPAPRADAKVGEVTMGTLTFATNEPGTSTHQITLATTLFGGGLEFLDKSGNPLPSASLTLSYSSPDQCPGSTTYRVHNTGNLAFMLTGPTFPAHFGGTSTGESGVSVTPDGYAEFMIGGVAASGEECSANGQLAFTAGDGFCGPVPTLNVIWPQGSLTNCVCTAPKR